jgi:hypothetical protein
MADTLDARLIDRRTWDRYLRNGELDEKEYERYLKNLPDVADKATTVQTVMDASDEEPVPPPATAP